MRKRTDDPKPVNLYLSARCVRQLADLGRWLGLGSRSRGRVVERAVAAAWADWKGGRPPWSAAARAEADVDGKPDSLCVILGRPARRQLARLARADVDGAGVSEAATVRKAVAELHARVARGDGEPGRAGKAVGP